MKKKKLARDLSKGSFFISFLNGEREKERTERKNRENENTERERVERERKKTERCIRKNT